jgi:hypothetical protein
VELRLRPETLSVCRLAAAHSWPAAPDDGSLFATSSSDDERSLVCRVDLVPEGAVVEAGWRALTVSGPLDFDLVGVLAGLTTPLARAGISVFVLSSFDTDHLMVRSADLEKAVVTLTEAGYRLND